MAGSRGMLAAKQPLVVPMLLRLSHFKLNSYVVLVVSKQKGITLVFKTDPLQNVDINSTLTPLLSSRNLYSGRSRVNYGRCSEKISLASSIVLANSG